MKSPGPYWWVKIGDFGITKRAEEGLLSLVGTCGFWPPEILAKDLLRGEELTVAMDIWALGEITFRALTRERPFPIPDSLVTYVRGTSSFPLHDLIKHGVSSDGCDFLKSLMAPTPKDRLTAEEALGHVWVEPQKRFSVKSSAEMQRYLFSTSGHTLTRRTVGELIFFFSDLVI